MLKIITTLTIFLIGMLAKGQVTENRNVSRFSNLALANGIELIYDEDQSTSLHIESANSELLKNTIAEADGKTLNGHLSEGTKSISRENTKVCVSTKDIPALKNKAKINIVNQITAGTQAFNMPDHNHLVSYAEFIPMSGNQEMNKNPK